MRFELVIHGKHFKQFCLVMLTFHDNMSAPKIQMTFVWFSFFFLMKNYGITESIEFNKV